MTYTLQTSLVAVPTFGFAPVSPDAMFTLTATVTVTPSGSTTFQIKGVVDAFTITILEEAQVIQIPFGASDGSTPGATFTASSGAKSSIQVNVGSPPSSGPSTSSTPWSSSSATSAAPGVSIDVGPTQISASLSLSLPSVGCGVFNLENLALSASVVVPFLGGATVATFGFCSQEQPFTLTVLCFGGGGYLLVGVGLHSLQSLTASFDFEGQLALDLGVASGGVSVMAGITFSYAAGARRRPSPASSASPARSRCWASSASPSSSQLSLSYTTPNTATGTATMTVSVSLCFFSVSVGITVQKSFSGPDPSSSSMMSAGPRASARAPASPAADHGPGSPTHRPVGQHLRRPPSRTRWIAADWSHYCKAFAG